MIYSVINFMDPMLLIEFLPQFILVYFHVLTFLHLLLISSLLHVQFEAPFEVKALVLLLGMHRGRMLVSGCRQENTGQSYCLGRVDDVRVGEETVVGDAVCALRDL